MNGNRNGTDVKDVLQKKKELMKTKPKNLEEVIREQLDNFCIVTDNRAYKLFANAIVKATIKAIVPEEMNDKRLGKKNRYLNNYSFIFNQCRSEMKKRAGEWVGEDKQ